MKQLEVKYQSGIFSVLLIGICVHVLGIFILKQILKTILGISNNHPHFHFCVELRGY